MANATGTMQNVTVKFFVNDKANPAGKVADVEIIFADGVFAGLKLVGFALWERKGGARIVTFPARAYSVSGERRSFALLRPVIDATAQERVRDLILTAYTEYQAVA